MVGKINMYLRLKPSLSATPDATYYRINSNSEIQLLVPPNNREPYYFNSIYNDDSDMISRDLSKICSDSALSGTNVALVCLGARDSGKTYTFCGDENGKNIRNSMCFSVVSELFESIKNTPKEKNCSITVSFIEIENEIVKDLGMAYYKRDEMRLNEVIKVLVSQDLEIKEATGKSYVEDACIIQIINPNEIINVISMGFKAREIIGTHGDCVFCITLSQRIKTEIQSARIFLVDFQSSSSLNTSEDSCMSSLSKVLNKVNLANLNVQVASIPFKATKLTYLLQNGLSNSTVLVVSHIDTDPGKFKESYEILNFSKGILEIETKIKLAMMTRPDSSRTADWARRLRDEIAELDSNLKKTQALYEEKLKSFGKLIGIEEDLEILLVAEKGSKEYELCRKYREAIQSVKNLTQRNAELEKKAENFRKTLSVLQKEHNGNAEKNRKCLADLKNQIREAKETLESYEELREKTTSEKVMLSTENLEKMLYHSHYVLEEKSAMIQTLKSQMENNTSDLRNILDIKDLGRSELETDFKRQIMDNEYNHNQRIAGLERDFTKKCHEKDDLLSRSIFELTQKKRDLNTRLDDLKAEAVKLFEIARLQGKAIYDIEKGRYNKGICPVLIPRGHNPQVPSENRFPMIFAALGSQALEVARTSTKLKATFSYNPTKSVSSSLKSTFRDYDRPSFQNVVTSISSLLEQPVEWINTNELRSIGSELKKIIKQNIEKVNSMYKNIGDIKYEMKNLEDEIKTIDDEKDKYKECYQRELRKRMDKAEEEPEKQMQKFFMTELISRPGTQRNIHTSYKMLRNIHTTISGHRLPTSKSPSIKFETLRPSTTAAPLITRIRIEKNL